MENPELIKELTVVKESMLVKKIGAVEDLIVVMVRVVKEVRVNGLISDNLEDIEILWEYARGLHIINYDRYNLF